MGEVGRSHFIPTAYAAQAHPGVCVIIVNQKFPNLPMRDGAKVDFELLASTFGNLGFKVIAMFDATDIDILRILEKVCAMDHSRYSNFVLVISSHGESGQTEDHNAVNRDYIMTTNGRRVFYDTITSYFTESKCPSLKDKPKLFFIQACRGDQSCNTTEADQSSSEITPPSRGYHCQEDSGPPLRRHIRDGQDIPLARDMLLACCTPPAFKALHHSKGSWFIEALCEVLESQHKHQDLLGMMNAVRWKVATECETESFIPKLNKRRTIPWIVSMLRKDVCL